MKIDDLNRTIKNNIITKLTVLGPTTFATNAHVISRKTCFFLVSKCCINFLVSFNVYGKSEAHNGDSIEFVTIF